MNTAAAQAAIPPACIVAADPAVTSRNAPTARVSAWRTEAIRRTAAAIDEHSDAYAEHGDFASLGDLHRAEGIMRRLLAGSVSV